MPVSVTAWSLGTWSPLSLVPPSSATARPSPRLLSCPICLGPLTLPSPSQPPPSPAPSPAPLLSGPLQSSTHISPSQVLPLAPSATSLPLSYPPLTPQPFLASPWPFPSLPRLPSPPQPVCLELHFSFVPLILSCFLPLKLLPSPSPSSSSPSSLVHTEASSRPSGSCLWLSHLHVVCLLFLPVSPPPGTSVFQRLVHSTSRCFICAEGNGPLCEISNASFTHLHSLEHWPPLAVGWGSKCLLALALSPSSQCQPGAQMGNDQRQRKCSCHKLMFPGLSSCPTSSCTFSLTC